MGLAIENCQGNLHVFTDRGSENGFYAIDPEIPEGRGTRALIMGVPLDFQEIVQPTVTLDDRRALYLFGSAWNQMPIAGLLLLGRAGSGGGAGFGDQLGDLMKWYQENRVSEKKGPIDVSIGGSAAEAFVVGLRLGRANPKFNTQPFTIMTVTADVDI